MQSASVVKIQSNLAAASAKASKWTGSSLFQNTVGMPASRRPQGRPERRAMPLGEVGDVVANAPPLPSHIDSTNSRAGLMLASCLGHAAQRSADVDPTPGRTPGARTRRGSWRRRCRVPAGTSLVRAGRPGALPAVLCAVATGRPGVARAVAASARWRSPARRRGTGRCCATPRPAARGCDEGSPLVGSERGVAAFGRPGHRRDVTGLRRSAVGRAG